MRPEPRGGAAVAGAPATRRPALRALPARPNGEEGEGEGPRVVASATRDTRRPLRVADVALFYGERSGGIRTYLQAKASFAARTGAMEEHLIVPGPREHHAGGRHELPSLRLATSNGYRIPLGAARLQATLRALEPDVVLLHDPFWAPLGLTRVAHELGAPVVAVHHTSVALTAHGLPGPTRLYAPLLRAWFRAAYRPVDAIMSAVDPGADAGRGAALGLRFGLHDAFRPRPALRRGDHILYAGRLAPEKGIFALLEAAARAQDPWPMRIVGAGPSGAAVWARAQRLGLASRVEILPHEADPARLAAAYATAACVVMPGEHETFGLVALEAAASGGRVVACANAPSTVACGRLVHTFAPGDRAGMLAAIETARRTPVDHMAAAAVAAAHGWPSAFAAELHELESLVA